MPPKGFGIVALSDHGELLPHALELLRSMFAAMSDDELRQVAEMLEQRRRELESAEDAQDKGQG